MKISQKLGARQEPRSRESHITVSWLLKSIARPILLVLIRVFEKFLLFLFPLSAAVMFLHMLGSHSKHSSVYVSLNSHWHFGILKLCFMFCGNRMQEVDVELSLVLEFQKNAHWPLFLHLYRMTGIGATERSWGLWGRSGCLSSEPPLAGLRALGNLAPGSWP